MSTDVGFYDGLALLYRLIYEDWKCRHFQPIQKAPHHHPTAIATGGQHDISCFSDWVDQKMLGKIQVKMVGCSTLNKFKFIQINKPSNQVIN